MVQFTKQWHRWFALWPVYAYSPEYRRNVLVWLEWVEWRRMAWGAIEYSPIEH
jgi:hypothetical protein